MAYQQSSASDWLFDEQLLSEVIDAINADSLEGLSDAEIASLIATVARHIQLAKENRVPTPEIKIACRTANGIEWRVLCAKK
jgi:hypothetical protein